MPVDTAQIIIVWHKRYSASPAHVWLRDQIAALLEPLDEAV
jgi:DNA-binding transcriptional LysR family regulator